MPDAIYPTGKIELYYGIKLDNTYQHALSFANENARETFFNTTTLKKYSLTALQYQRVTLGSCEVAISIGNLYDVNYMRFQNADYSTKWFYAFITNVEYINDANTRIFYEIDVNTTFYFDWDYLPCFVEREHSATDVIGENIVEEPIKFGEPVAMSRLSRYFGQWVIFIAITQEYGDIYRVTKSGQMINGVYLEGYNTTEVTDNFGPFSAFQERLKTISASREDIISMFMYPKELVRKTSQPGADVIEYESESVGFTAIRPATLNGYTPKNKKLFTYPYNYLCVDNGTITNNYRWEYFNQLAGISLYTFVIRGAVSPAGSIYAAPLGYKGLGVYGSLPGLDNYIPCFDERLDLPALPQVAYPLDSYMAWLAQTESSRKNKIITGAAAGVGTGLAAGAKLGGAIGSAGGPIGTAGGAVIGAALGGVLGAIGAKAANDMAMTEAADMKNKSAGGGNGTLEIVDNKFGVTFKYMTINASDAKIIDDFFNMFGYAQNTIKTPSIRTRPHWNYIKTNGLNMNYTSTHGIPAEYVRKIKAIHDNGVTFWKSHDEIGNYALNNGV